jgi:hypothetical protein
VDKKIFLLYGKNSQMATIEPSIFEFFLQSLLRIKLFCNTMRQADSTEVTEIRKELEQLKLLVNVSL